MPPLKPFLEREMTIKKMALEKIPTGKKKETRAVHGVEEQTKVLFPYLRTRGKVVPFVAKSHHVLFR
jgi:hypothetical protein